MFPISITCGKEEHLSLPMEVLINRINGNDHLNLSVIVNHVEKIKIILKYMKVNILRL